ncbi:Crp/Fnr family transcriptional regulator [Croceivirga thetidis]|nr:Crp/Fnr family transcriptional regulator [Croceivirga thetidis]
MIRVNSTFLDYIVTLKNSSYGELITEKQAEFGEKIIEQKTNVRYVFLIKEGLAKCYLTEDTGEDFIQEFFGKGEVFGEIELITNNISFCTIEALTPTTYFKIPKRVFHDLIKKDEAFNTQILELMAGKVRYTALRHSYNQTHSIEEILKSLLLQYPDLLKLISKKDISNYLGITVRSLNRVLKTVIP